MVTIQFDNIFDAVTSNKEEASELETRSDLMGVVRDIIDDNAWSQKEAAKNLKVSQPRVSDLKNGKIEKFSIDQLMTYLYRLGFRFNPIYKKQKLEIKVLPAVFQ